MAEVTLLFANIACSEYLAYSVTGFRSGLNYFLPQKRRAIQRFALLAAK